MCLWPLGIYLVLRKQAEVTHFPRKVPARHSTSLSHSLPLSRPLFFLLICKRKGPTPNVASGRRRAAYCTSPCCLTSKSLQRLSLKTVKSWRQSFKHPREDLRLLSTYLRLDPTLLCLPGSSRLNSVRRLSNCFVILTPDFTLNYTGIGFLTS